MLIVLCAVLQTVQAQASGDSSIVDTAQSDTGKTVSPNKKQFKTTFDSEINFDATDSMTVRLKKREVFLYGDAHMKYGELDVKAAIISIDFDKKMLKALPLVDSAGNTRGDPKFSEKGKTYEAKEINYNYETRRGLIKSLITMENDGLVKGQVVKKDEFDNMYINEASYTTCTDTSDPHFYILAEKMKVIPGKKIVSGPALLYVGDVPTPGLLPFGFFPITDKRSSGLILPNYGYWDGRGYYLKNGGYYFGISDYLDAALTGDIYANLSWRLNATTYYAKRYKYNGNLSLEYAKAKTGEKEDLDFSVLSSYFFRWNHALDPKARPNTNFNARVEFGSSNFLKLNSFNTNDIVDNSLNSSISYNRVFGGGKSSLGVGVNHSQNTRTRAVNIGLPQITYDVSRFFPFRSKDYMGNGKWYEEIGVNYQAIFKNELNTYDTLFDQPDILAKQLRYGMSHSLPIATNVKILKYVNMSPGVNLNAFMYMNTVEKNWDPANKVVDTDTVPGFVTAYSYDVYTNFSTILYGMYQLNGSKITAIRHVVTPSVNFSYRPDFSENKYGFYKQVQTDSTGNEFVKYSRFEQGIFGGPDMGEVGAMSFNLGNNIEMKMYRGKDTARKLEKVKIFDFLNFSTGYNFLAEEFKLAPIRIGSQTTLFEKLIVQVNASIDPYALDSVGQRENTFLYDRTWQLGRLTQANITLNTSLNSESFKKKEDRKKVTPRLRNPYLNSRELMMLNMPGGYVDFEIPWNFSVSYIYNYSKPGFTAIRNQTINLTGDFSITQKWKIGFSTGYVFDQKEISLTTIDFYRDLHCWEFRFNWMPFGERRFFNFGINAKSSVLQDLKLNRRRDWYDR